MKWIKIGARSNTPSEDDLASFEYFPDQESVDNEFQITRPATGQSGDPNISLKQSNLWATYEFEKFMKPQKQWEYEIFCGGFLAYYDSIARNNSVEHKLYFDWSEEKENGPFHVSVYISPKPFKALKGVPDDLGKEDNAEEALNLDSVSRAAGSPAGLAAARSIDPPPPPPPPPPPRG